MTRQASQRCLTTLAAGARVFRFPFPRVIRHLATNDKRDRMTGMTISKIRSWLYPLAKYLGDIQALTSKRKGAINKRVQRRIAGHFTGRALGRIFR